MPFADINGLHYHYQIIGQGPALVMLHGFTGSLENWNSARNCVRSSASCANR